MKKKIPHTKPRCDWVFGIVEDVASGITITYDRGSDSLRLHEAEPNSMRLDRTYTRDSGKEKVVASIKSNGPKVSFNPFQMLKQNYDYLVAVDTNTRWVDGVKLSICFSYVVPRRLSEHDDEVPFVPLCGYALVNVHESINPETLGWHLILQNHIDTAPARLARIGMIVDSELGGLPKINRRETPYFGEHKLPSHVTLIYASDAMRDTLPNQMLGYCHSTAERASDHLVNHMKALKELSNGQGFCDGYARFS